MCRKKGEDSGVAVAACEGLQRCWSAREHAEVLCCAVFKRGRLQVWAVVLLLGEKLHGTAARVPALALAFTAAAVGPGASAHRAEQGESRCRWQPMSVTPHCIPVLS